MTRKTIANFREGLYSHTHKTGKDMGNGVTYFSKADNSIPIKHKKRVWCRVCLKANTDELWCFEKKFINCDTYCSRECFEKSFQFEEHMAHAEKLNDRLDAIKESRLCLA